MPVGWQITILIVGMTFAGWVGWQLCRIWYLDYARCKHCGYQSPAADFKGRCPRCEKTGDLIWIGPQKED